MQPMTSIREPTASKVPYPKGQREVVHSLIYDPMIILPRWRARFRGQSHGMGLAV